MSFKNKVVYQVYPKSFQDSNHDGWGDIQGIISRLDYLKDLGVDIIWFNPMCISPQKDNGYDVTNYREIDPRYGTMEDFEQLSQACKDRNIQIMFDMVFNHTSTTHEWFQRALQGEQKYKDYYFFRKKPTNWQSKFGGSAWEYVPEFDEYYLHLYDKTQADLNWDNPDVRNECADIVNYWIDKGVHCFRFDVVNLISKETVDKDDPNQYDGRQFYTDGPRVHQYLQELNEKSFSQCSDSVTVGEMSSTTLDDCVLYANENGKELSMVFTFHHLKVDYKDGMKWELKPFDFLELKSLLSKWQVGMQEAGAWNALFFNNHDQPRALSRFLNDKKYRKESAKLLAIVTHCMRGTPYIYQGEEIGMINPYFTDINQYVDVESINMFQILKDQGKSEEEVYHILQQRSRDDSRTPMQWDDSKNAGFTQGTPWIQVADSYKDINVKKELTDEDGILATYKKLIQMRKEYDVIQNGMYVPLLEKHPQVFAFERQTDNEKLLVVTNFYEQEVTLDLDTSQYSILLSNYKDAQPSQTLQLRPYEAIVFYK